MPLVALVAAAGTRLRILITRLLGRFGAGGDAFLVIVAVLIGLVTAAAAVGFHTLIVETRTLLYERFGEQRLYGPWLFMLVVWPALGGLTVGVLARYVLRAREGHGVVDVMESVIRSRGFMRPSVAFEKILTSAVTIGTGGSCGAEGPIVQIGAAIASGVASLFNIARQQMPTIVACGAAAGISAIFNSPMGGMLFALEVILQDFSIRNVTPVVVASVIANVATQAIFRRVLHEDLRAIFSLPGMTQATLTWTTIGHYAILGIACGAVGVTLTRLMYYGEEWFHRLRASPALRPAIGGAIVGVMGVGYVLFFGRLLAGQHKPIPFSTYPMPAFFGDGYGFIQLLLTPEFYNHTRVGYFLCILLFLLVAKVVATCVTLGSGGSGGVIAPALFLGSVTGGLLGMLLKLLNPQDVTVHAEVYALVGMGAVLAAIVHAPLASILILLELTRDSSLVLPAMLATVIATGTARLVLPDSIYTLALRRRGVRVSGGGADRSLLHRMHVEQVDLEPATLLKLSDPFQRVLELMNQTHVADFAVVDDEGTYKGMIVAEDVRTALVEREAVPLLLVEEMIRTDVPYALTSDDLAKTMDAFAKYDISHLAACFPGRPGRVIGLIGRASLMRRYQQELQGQA